MICNLCKKPINILKDKYTHVEDWECRRKLSEFWCHVECFRKSMNRDLTALEKRAATMLNLAGGIFENLPEEIKPKEEFVIK